MNKTAETYLKSLPRMVRAALAERAGTKLSYLQYAINGKKSVSIELACRLELASNGRITRRDIRPDVDWDLIEGTSVATMLAEKAQK